MDTVEPFLRTTLSQTESDENTPPDGLEPNVPAPPEDMESHVPAPPEDMESHVPAPPEDMESHVPAPPEDMESHVPAPQQDVPNGLVNETYTVVHPVNQTFQVAPTEEEPDINYTLPRGRICRHSSPDGETRDLRKMSA